MQAVDADAYGRGEARRRRLSAEGQNENETENGITESGTEGGEVAAASPVPDDDAIPAEVEESAPPPAERKKAVSFVPPQLPPPRVDAAALDAAPSVDAAEAVEQRKVKRKVQPSVPAAQTHEEQVANLSVKELKKTITDARLSHGDCFEKSELRVRAVAALGKRADAVARADAADAAAVVANAAYAAAAPVPRGINVATSATTPAPPVETRRHSQSFVEEPPTHIVHRVPPLPENGLSSHHSSSSSSDFASPATRNTSSDSRSTRSMRSEPDGTDHDSPWASQLGAYLPLFLLQDIVEDVGRAKKKEEAEMLREEEEQEEEGGDAGDFRPQPRTLSSPIPCPLALRAVPWKSTMTAAVLFADVSGFTGKLRSTALSLESTLNVECTHTTSPPPEFSYHLTPPAPMRQNICRYDPSGCPCHLLHTLFTRTDSLRVPLPLPPAMSEMLNAREGRRGPEKLAKVLTGYLDRMTKHITKGGGEVMKFVGDALLVVFSNRCLDASVVAQAGSYTTRTYTEP